MKYVMHPQALLEIIPETGEDQSFLGFLMEKKPYLACTTISKAGFSWAEGRRESLTVGFKDKANDDNDRFTIKPLVPGVDYHFSMHFGRSASVKIGDPIESGALDDDGCGAVFAGTATVVAITTRYSCDVGSPNGITVYTKIDCNDDHPHA